MATNSYGGPDMAPSSLPHSHNWDLRCLTLFMTRGGLAVTSHLGRGVCPQR